MSKSEDDTLEELIVEEYDLHHQIESIGDRMFELGALLADTKDDSALIREQLSNARIKKRYYSERLRDVKTEIARLKIKDGTFE